MLESLFNKVTHLLSYDFCGIFNNTYFLITPQNQTTLLRKQISKVVQRRQSHVYSLVHWYFTKHFSKLSYHFFSQSPKIVFWTNCAFPLKAKSVRLFKKTLLVAAISYCDSRWYSCIEAQSNFTANCDNGLRTCSCVAHTQLTLTYSKLAIKTLEKGVKYVQN